ncbi:NAD-dependent epimerase/dehydratase family protein [Lichenicoccus sp.]|uniref:NAD-dependent epimerase/dehydratase family protein n=1 Tax=Lichenicoccus sp. TaxID=2781899 RepID=UPI003D0ABF4A
MHAATVIFGYGPVGRLVTAALVARGDRVIVAQRKRPAELPVGADFLACDILQPDAVRRAVAGAAQVLFAVGFAYDARVWRTAWPAAMTNVVEACAASGARIVFIDNLYQLGPQDRPRHEDMPLSSRGAKPPVLAEVTRIWMRARDRVRVAALRCPDFYGPDVPLAHLGATSFGRLARGKPALMVVPPDMPHDFAYVPDIARAAVTLLDAPDDAFGQVWNMPCARTRTSREILALGAQAIGRPLRLTRVPFRLLPLFGIFVRFMKEVADVGFTWNRPYIIDARKFERRFWSDVTPFEVGAPATAKSFAAAAAVPAKPALPQRLRRQTSS